MLEEDTFGGSRTTVESIEQAVKSSSKNLHAGQQNDERYPNAR